ICKRISFLASAAIWVHVEMPDATILSTQAAESREESVFAVRLAIRCSTTQAGLGSHRELAARSQLWSYRTSEIFTGFSTVGQDFDAKPRNSAQRTAKAE